MFRDISGKNRVKVNLHMHTSHSDGHVSPSEALRIYREHGYDAVALTDHWVQGKPYEEQGITVLAGCEFHAGGDPRKTGVYHIVGIGMEKEAVVQDKTNPQCIINAIREAGGLAILAHPAWSFNTPEQILALQNVEGIEIYNTVSDFAVNYRADSSDTIDQVAVAERYYPLIASDDAHYYSGDECKSYILVEADSPDRESILNAIRAEKFYASQGPEMDVRIENDTVTVDCTPASKVIFHTGTVWHSQAVVRGENITHAEFHLGGSEYFLRVSVTDKDGKRAWSNFVVKS